MIDKTISQLQMENQVLRRLLWQLHGCSIEAHYGDDGEMQCHSCRLDFKRDSVARIDYVLTDERMEKALQKMNMNSIAIE